MNGTYFLIVLILILTVVVFYHHAEHFKKLYQDMVSPKGWKRIEIVEERSALDELFSADVSCGALEILSGAAACVVCFLMGWRLRNFHNSDTCSECSKKQTQIEQKVKNLQDKIDDFHRRYSLLTTELIYSSESNEIEIPLTKDAFQQMDTEGIDRSSQTSLPATQVEFESVEQESEKGDCHRNLEIEQDSEVNVVKSNHTFSVDNEFLDEIPTVLRSERKFSDSQHSITPIEQEQNIYTYDMANIQIDKTVVCKSETSEEIDVVTCSSTDDGGGSSKYQTEEGKCLMANKNSTQKVTVLDVVEPVPLPIGGGECEVPRSCKIVNLKGRIPQYQRLRKGTEQKSKYIREPDAAEEGRIFTTIHQIKATEQLPVLHQTTPRNTTPRAYSLTSSETTESTTATSRRRKQRNHNVK